MDTGFEKVCVCGKGGGGAFICEIFKLKIKLEFYIKKLFFKSKMASAAPHLNPQLNT